MNLLATYSLIDTLADALSIQPQVLLVPVLVLVTNLMWIDLIPLHPGLVFSHLHAETVFLVPVLAIVATLLWLDLVPLHSEHLVASLPAYHLGHCLTGLLIDDGPREHPPCQ